MTKLRQEKSPANIRPKHPPLDEWRTLDPRGRIQALYTWAESSAVEVIDWYLREKMAKSRWSRGLRLLAIIGFAIGGVMPLIGTSIGGSATLLSTGYVSLATGAAAVAFDRFFGFSSSWMRYVSTAFRLQSRLQKFQLDWIPRESPNTASADLDDEQLAEAIALVRSLLVDVADEVARETDAWVREFQSLTSGLSSRPDSWSAKDQDRPMTHLADPTS